MGSAAAAKALGQIGPDAREALPGLGKVLADPNAQGRKSAVAALGKIGDEAVPLLSEALKEQAAIPALEKAARDRDEAVQDAATEALRQIKGE